MPRSCPSSPTFASSTRILFSPMILLPAPSELHRHAVLAPAAAHHLRDLADRGVGLDRANHRRHHVPVAFDRRIERRKTRIDLAGAALGAQRGHALLLALLDRRVDLE